MNYIYGYLKKDLGEYVYIGQTINIDQRRKKHEQYDPFNQNVKEYYYPLSRGIRKYGIEMYEFHILEEVPSQDILDEREIYWINYYNTYNDPKKYNLTPGGSPKNYKKGKFEDAIIDMAYDLIKNTNKPFNEISSITGISVVMLSEINTGKRRKRDNEVYPLRELTQGRILTQQQVLEIVDLLKNDFISNTEIAKRYNVSAATIQAINNGKRSRLQNEQYPLRTISYANNKLSKQDVQKICDEILSTDKSLRQIAKENNCSLSTIRLINSGEKYSLNNYSYPLRQN